ncbi:uncharacterized protein LOC123552196 [Mercenaria mercenaria]|uniref:uncharacterized protein LOC123552196 n=1 Tax=Mercenaria mercenaria TaxID=6596 RepID=UPI00234E4D74|nr:uncharacterized protein LOC123552196 [Mercenaria mercenaria]
MCRLSFFLLYAIGYQIIFESKADMGTDFILELVSYFDTLMTEVNKLRQEVTSVNKDVDVLKSRYEIFDDTRKIQVKDNKQTPQAQSKVISKDEQDKCRLPNDKHVSSLIKETIKQEKTYLRKTIAKSLLCSSGPMTKELKKLARISKILKQKYMKISNEPMALTAKDLKKLARRSKILQQKYTKIGHS